MTAVAVALSLTVLLLVLLLCGAVYLWSCANSQAYYLRDELQRARHDNALHEEMASQ